MELNIHSPSYYSNIYGIDDEIYWMCRELAQYFKNKKYSDFINMIDILPIAAPKELTEKGAWKEIKKVELKAGFAAVSLQMDFEKYMNADIEKKKGLIIDNILKSIKVIKGRAKINYLLFENDMKLFCKSNNIIFGIEKIEEILFQQTVDISNYLASNDFDYLFNKGYLNKLSENDILSKLNDYGGNLSIIDKKEYNGKFCYCMLQDCRYHTELDLVFEDYVTDLTLSCELSVENDKIIEGVIEDIQVL